MPTYDFQCKACQQIVTITAKMDELKTPQCLQCLTNMHRLFKVNGVQFKGRGFYTNDKREDT
jgi:putative FmdB family regulatory protein